jgi:hypothetical protein
MLHVLRFRQNHNTFLQNTPKAKAVFDARRTLTLISVPLFSITNEIQRLAFWLTQRFLYQAKRQPIALDRLRVHVTMMDCPKLH